MFVLLNVQYVVYPIYCLIHSMFDQLNACFTQCLFLSHSMFVPPNVYHNQCLTKPIFVPLDVCPIHCLSYPMFVPFNICQTQCLSHSLFVQLDVCPSQCRGKYVTFGWSPLEVTKISFRGYQYFALSTPFSIRNLMWDKYELFGWPQLEVILEVT